jgi:hypothetical protein
MVSDTDNNSLVAVKPQTDSLVHEVSPFPGKQCMIIQNDCAAVILPALDVFEFDFDFLQFNFDCFNHNGSIFLEIKGVVSVKPGFGIMLTQFGCSLLFGISITILQDAYGTFTHEIDLGELITSAFGSPAKNILTELDPP